METQTLESTASYFNRSLFNAMQPSAILDDTGRIVDVNQAWIDFGKQNGGDGNSIGLNYLVTCETSSGPTAGEAPSARWGNHR